MNAAWIVLLLWVLFAATHTVLCHPPVRAPLVSRLGLRGYLLLYSLVALATFVPLVWVFFASRTAHTVPLPVLVQTPGIWWLTMALMGVAILLLVLGFSRPNPVSVLMNRSGAAAAGALRITRHPAFMGVALMGAAHLLVNHSLLDRVFFGGLLLYALLGCAHQDWRRRQAGEPGTREYFAETSFLPFVAILQGRNRLVLRELNPLALVLAVLLFGLIFLFHHRVMG
ncbi:denitrification regulatory protein [Isoalcanivorax pacificus W11-5]|uniref:Denitrification regulatory protein n=1 Tax=Isoalcanivorax pacificus W11-5 TaxID=391936 RepID=A0A0B4XT96_9GAMM|nr:denitrification regulatory protein [Isoalcanivorax pacificus]AJD49920.1 denitrification regulatory protein [Isoalcanivorax pacificus W11-5]